MVFHHFVYLPIQLLPSAISGGLVIYFREIFACKDRIKPIKLTSEGDFNLAQD